MAMLQICQIVKLIIRHFLTAAERGQRTGPANLANKLARHRVLHFKDADAYMAYHAEYGKGSVLTGVLNHLDMASRNLALMEKLGPNPEAMLKSLIAEQTRGLRVAAAGGAITRADIQALKTLQNAEGLSHGKVAGWWAELTGMTNAPVNIQGARLMATARATQTLSKLGGAALSATADAFIKAMNIRVQGVSWGEALTESIRQYFRSYKGNKRVLARQLGAFVDDVAGEMRLRWDLNEDLPGKLAGVQDKFFRWSGLNWITETGKAGYAMWFSGHFGEVAGKTWDELDPARKATLEWHGIAGKKWDALRSMTEQSGGRTLLVPQRADALPDNVLRLYKDDALTEATARFQGDDAAFALVERRILDDARRELRTDLMRMISDETQFAIIEPDAKTRAWMRHGTRPGTVAGEFARTIMQFKSFPIAYLVREMGGQRWKRADIAAAGGHDIRGAVGAAVSAFAFGYLAMTLKDLAKGREPRDLTKVETVFAALMQSGGAGIIGDLFFNRVNRFGVSGLAGTLTGPLIAVAVSGASPLTDSDSNFSEPDSALTDAVLIRKARGLANGLSNEAGRVFNVVSEAMRGELVHARDDALRVTLDNTPFINLWYTREALNWGILYHIRESLSPGTLRRTERKLKEEYGQAYMLSPARHIKRGGGFR